MDGLVFVIDQLGRNLQAAAEEIARLRAQNEQLTQALAATNSHVPQPEMAQ